MLKATIRTGVTEGRGSFLFLVSSDALVKDAADNSRDGRLMVEVWVESFHFHAFSLPQFRRSKSSKAYHVKMR